MTRVKWAVFILICMLVGMAAGAALVEADPLAVFALPTLAPTLTWPTQPPAIAVVTATSTSTSTPTPTETPSPTSTPRATSTRVPTRTPAPTLPPPSTATPTALLTPAASPTPFPFATPRGIGMTATITGALPIPTPVPPVEGVPDSINILVLGSDRRPDWNHWRTDVVQLVSIQPLVPAVTILSIPRDLYVYIPGFWMSRINFADMYGEQYSFEGGSFALLQQAMLYNLGIRVDHYVRTDFDGLIGIVDTLGGVDIPVHCRLEDHWPYADENGVYPIKVMEPGMQHMDGETALWYARSRLTSSTFSRERRQQQVLQAIWRKARSLELLTQLPQLWEQSNQMIVTDMTFKDVAELGALAFRLDERNVRFRNIGRQHVIPWTTPNGGSVFLPNWEELGPLVSEALGPIPEGRMWRQLQTVEVWNGTATADWDQLAADRLLREGFGVTIGQADRRDYAQTQLVDYSISPKGSAASYLQQLFGIPAANVVSSPDANSPARYRLIIGADYQTCPGY